MLTEEEFVDIYKKEFRPLCWFGWSLVKDYEEGKDLCQNAFLGLWKCRKTCNISIAKLFVMKSMRNAAYNVTRHNQTVNKHKPALQYEFNTELDIQTQEQQSIKLEFISLLYQAIECLSPQRKKIILLTLKEVGKKRHELAKYIGISKNTFTEHKLEAYRNIRVFINSRLFPIPISEGSTLEKTEDNCNDSQTLVEPIMGYYKCVKRIMVDPLIIKTEEGSYIAIGHTSRGNEIKAVLSPEMAIRAIQNGSAKQGW